MEEMFPAAVDAKMAAQAAQTAEQADAGTDLSDSSGRWDVLVLAAARRDAGLQTDGMQTEEKEAQTSDQRILLSKALHSALLRARAQEELVEQYDQRLVEAVVEALEKLEDVDVQQEICMLLDIQRLAASVPSPSAPAAAPPPDAASEANSQSAPAPLRQTSPVLRSQDTRRTDESGVRWSFGAPLTLDQRVEAEVRADLSPAAQRSRILEQLAHLKTHSRLYLEQQQRQQRELPAVAPVSEPLPYRPTGQLLTSLASPLAAPATMPGSMAPALPPVAPPGAAPARARPPAGEDSATDPPMPISLGEAAAAASPAPSVSHSAPGSCAHLPGLAALSSPPQQLYSPPRRGSCGSRPVSPGRVPLGRAAGLADDEGMRYTRQVLGLAARAALAQRRVEVERARAAAAEARVAQLEAQLASVLADRGETDPGRDGGRCVAGAAGGKSGSRDRVATARRSLRATLSVARVYLASLYSWLMDWMSQVTASALRLLSV